MRRSACDLMWSLGYNITTYPQQIKTETCSICCRAIKDCKNPYRDVVYCCTTSRTINPQQIIQVEFGLKKCNKSVSSATAGSQSATTLYTNIKLKEKILLYFLFYSSKTIFIAIVLTFCGWFSLCFFYTTWFYLHMSRDRKLLCGWRCLAQCHL